MTWEGDKIQVIKPLWAHYDVILDGLPLRGSSIHPSQMLFQPITLSSVGIASKSCPSTQFFLLHSSNSLALIPSTLNPGRASSLFEDPSFHLFHAEAPTLLHPPNQPTWHQSSSEMGSSLSPIFKKSKINISSPLCSTVYGKHSPSIKNDQASSKRAIFPISPCKCYPQPSTICLSPPAALIWKSLTS